MLALVTALLELWKPCMIHIQLSVIINSKSLTHGGDHVSCGALVFGEPEGCQLGGGENDEGLCQRTKGLAQHHYDVLDCITLARRCPTEARHGPEHVQPGSHNQLQKSRWQEGERSKRCNRFKKYSTLYPPFLAPVTFLHGTSQRLSATQGVVSFPWIFCWWTFCRCIVKAQTEFQ